MSTLFSRLGGSATVDTAVDRLYKHILADTDMDRRRAPNGDQGHDNALGR